MQADVGGAAFVGLTAKGITVLSAWQAANDQRLGKALQRLPEAYQRAIEGAAPALAALLESDDQIRVPTGNRTVTLTAQASEPTIKNAGVSFLSRHYWGLLRHPMKLSVAATMGRD